MRTRLRGFLSPPIFEDENKTRVAALLNLILLSLLVAAFPLAVFMLLVPNDINRVLWWSTFATVAESCVLLLVLRRGHVQAASFLAIAGFWLILTIHLIPLGGLRSPVFSAYFIVILMAGLLLGGKAAIGVAVCSILASFGILLLEVGGLLPDVTYTASAEWMVKAAFFFVIAVLAYLAISVTQKALARAGEIEKTLTERNQQLEREIAERVAAEQKLSTSEKRFRALIEHNHECVSLINPDGSVSYMSPAVKHILGYDEAEMVGHDGASLVHPDDFPHVNGKLIETVQNPGLTTSATYRLRHQDGSWRWVEGEATNLLHDPNLGAIVLNFRDITERRQAEEQLHYQATLLENISDAVVSVDTSYTLRSWNKAAEEVYGWKAEEVIGRRSDFLETEYVSGMRDEAMQTLIRDGFWKGETRQRHKNGSRIWVMSSASVLRDAAGNPTVVVSVNRDITERKQAEEKLRLSEERYRIISELSSDYAYAFRVDSDTEATLEWVTEAYTRVTGYSLEDMTKLSQWDSTVHPDDMENLREARRRMLAKQPMQPSEFRIITKSGEARWLNNHLKAVWDETGARIIRVYGTAQDITERKLAEAKLRESEKRFRALVENSSDAIALFGDDGTIRYGSPSTINVLGYALDEFEGHSAFEFIHPDDHDFVISRLQQSLDQPGTGVNVHARVKHKNGQWRLLEGIFTNLLDEPGVQAVVNNYRDITERKQAESKMRQSEKMFRTLVESAPQSILLVNTTGEIVLANSKVREMFGYAPDELVGQPVDLLVPERYRSVHEQHRAGFAARPSARPMDGIIGLMARRKDGSEFPAEIGLNYAEMDDGLLVMSFVTDITERKQAENKLRESEERFRTMLEGLPIGCILNDTDSRFTYWNPTAERMFGYTFDEVQGKLPYGFIVPPEYQASIADFNRRVLQGDEMIRTTAENITHDDRRIICEWTCTPLRDSDGTVAGIIAMCQDITQRKQLEDALQRTLDEMEQRVDERTAELRAAQERLRFLLSVTPVVIYSYKASPDYRATFVSNRVIDLLGYEPHDFLNDNRFWIERVHPDDADRIALETSKSYQVGRGTLEYRFRCADGEYRWLHDENRVVHDPDGNPLEVIGYWIDITEQKQVQQALVAAEERLRLTIDGAYEAFIAIDEAGVITDWNQQAEAVFGWSRREAIGQHLADTIIPPQQREAHRQGIKHFLATGEGPLLNQRIEVIALHQNGHGFPVELTITPIQLGNRYIFNAFLHDITERKRAEIALRESEERFRAISEATPIGMLVTRVDDGMILYVNEAQAWLFGVTQDDYLGLDGRDFYANPEVRPTLVERLKRDGYILNHEMQAKKADGTLFWVIYSCKLIFFGGEQAILTGMYDITNRKEAEDRVEQLNHQLGQRAQELEYTNRELEAFTYSVSHDLRAPLRALDGFSRILQQDFSAQLPNEAQRFLSLVRSNAQQMGNLISDLLNLSRLSRQPLVKKPVQLQQLVTDVYQSLSHERENRQVELVIAELPECQADPNLLKQVFVNLLSNALKFTREREVAHIEVGHQVVESESIYSVRDNGVGFDMQYANKLFGLFQRLHRMEDYEGTGVGLAIIQRIVRRHGGRVWAEAEVNKGAVFYFTLGD